MTPLSLENGESTNFGIGWITWEHNDQIWVGHTGRHVGGRTMFMINKEHRMVIAFTINRTFVGFNDLHWKLADIFLD
jgi:CubicO group peptidase (beta-lactamase class C family)